MKNRKPGARSQKELDSATIPNNVALFRLLASLLSPKSPAISPIQTNTMQAATTILNNCLQAFTASLQVRRVSCWSINSK